MPTQIVMPQLGESVVEGTVSRWLKREGEAVQAYEPLLEISTDKVETEIPAPAAGVLLHIMVQEGQTVGKGAVLGVIGEAQPAVQPQEGERASGGVTMAERETAAGNGHSPFVTPVVARMAAEYGVDLSRIQGSGRGGRVTKKDVEAYLAHAAVSVSAGSPQTQPPISAQTENSDLPPWERPGSGDLFKPSVEYQAPSAVSAQEMAHHLEASHHDVSPQRLHPVEAIPEAAEGELIALSPMRRAIAEHMTRSVKTSPHVTTVFEVDLSAVSAHRETHKAEFAAQGVNLTFTAYFAAAAIDALRAVPVVNTTWTDEGIRQHRAVHLGIAVSVTDGLIVPVIRHAGDLNLLGLARAINDAAHRARNKALKPDETQGGTFTITNHGVGGSLFATPIINQPQAGIMGVGVIEKRVKVITDERGNDMLSIRPCCYISLTFDHRTADGAVGDAFLLAVKRRLEGWEG